MHANCTTLGGSAATEGSHQPVQEPQRGHQWSEGLDRLIVVFILAPNRLGSIRRLKTANVVVGCVLLLSPMPRPTQTLLFLGILHFFSVSPILFRDSSCCLSKCMSLLTLSLLYAPFRPSFNNGLQGWHLVGNCSSHKERRVIYIPVKTILSYRSLSRPSDLEGPTPQSKRRSWPSWRPYRSS